MSSEPSTPSTPTADLAPGALVAGKYRIERAIGHGGVGTVYAAHNELLDRRVALKVIRDELALDSATLRRFVREARVTARFKSEHVARVLDCGVLGNGTPYIALELLVGRDLDQLVESSGPLAIPLAIDIVLQALVGIATAHAAGVAHRDLKPANLFLAEVPGRPPIVKVLDFGIAKAFKGRDFARGVSTSTSDVFGTPVYMSPEQLRSAKQADTRTDIWALGVILFEILTARLPFDTSNFALFVSAVMDGEPTPLSRYRQHVPAALEAAILRCLRRKPEERFQSAFALAEAIAPFGTRSSVDSLGEIVDIVEGDTAVKSLSSFGDLEGPPHEDAPEARRSPRVMALAIGGGVLLLVLALVLVVHFARLASR